MNILGIDYGEKRIGLSIADTDNGIAFPYKALENRGREYILDELIRIFEREKIEKIIIGLPLSTKMEETQESNLVREFSERLKEKISLEIIFENELFTTQEAQKMWSDAEPNKKTGIIDVTASQLVLQAYLDKKK